MAIIKRRPRVQVLVPRRVHPGDKLEVVFELDVARRVPIERFDVTLRGRTRIAVGDQGFAEAGVPLAQIARLSGPRELEPGKLRFPCRFKLPPDAPPTFHGRIVRVEYVLGAQIAIPWWVDVDSAFELDVAPAPHDAARSPKPLLYSSAPDGPEEREPHAEVSLADGVVQPGDVLRGAVALGNVAFARYTGIRVTLTGWEYAHGMERQGEFGGWQIELPLTDPREGEPIAFDLRVPDVPPSCSSDVFRVWWLLDVTVTRRLGADLVISLPITILPPKGAGPKDAQRLVRAPPTVGNERVQRVWSGVADRSGMRFEGERLEARVGAVDVTLWREHAAGRPVLVAELRYPSLGLDLESGPATGISRLWGAQGLAVAGCRVSGRDEAQVRALVGLVEPEIGSAKVRCADDQRIVLERAGAGLSSEPVEQLAASALALAARLPKLLRVLPLPSGIELEPWRALAETLGAELMPARPSLELEREGRRVEVRQCWSAAGAPSVVETSVGSSAPIPERWAGADPSSFPSEARALAEALSGDEAELVVASDRITLRRRGALADAEAVLGALDRLAALADLLARRGAYR